MTGSLKVEQWPTDRLVEYARNPRKNDAEVERMAGLRIGIGHRQRARLGIFDLDQRLVRDLEAASTRRATAVPHDFEPAPALFNERHMTKRGHPAFQPTDKQRGQVEAMARYGIPQDEIARAIGISRPTLLKYFAEEIETGATKANAQVGEFLFSTIIGAQIPGRPPVTDDRARVTAAIFWAKTRMNWKETSIHKHTGTEGDPIKIDARATLLDTIARVAAAATTSGGDSEPDGGTG